MKGSDEVVEWLTDGARPASNTREVVAELCDRLIGCGIPVWRFGLFVLTLHPQIMGQAFLWKPGVGVEVRSASFETFETEAFRQSPVRRVIDTCASLRRKLGEENCPIDFEVTRELRAQGATDYLAVPLFFASGGVHGTGRFLGWLVGRRIVPHIPVRDASERDDGTFSRSDFRWDRRRGVYVCPNDKLLHTTGTVHDGNTFRYRASKFDCEVCALKMQCCSNGPSRQIPRDVHEYARDVTRRLMRTKAFLMSRDQRKRVEMRFAHLKIHHGFERMRLRGLSGARDEFLLAATVQNLKTLALRILGPPPARQRALLA